MRGSSGIRALTGQFHKSGSHLDGFTSQAVHEGHRVGVFLHLDGFVVGGDGHVAVGAGSANRPAGEFVALMRGSSGIRALTGQFHKSGSHLDGFTSQAVHEGHREGGLRIKNLNLVVSVHVGEGIGAVSQRSRLTVNRHESQLIAGIAAEVDGRAAVVADCNGALRVGGSVDNLDGNGVRVAPPLGGIGRIRSYRPGNRGIPACKGVASASGRPIERGRRRVNQNVLIHLIFEDFRTVHTIGVSNGKAVFLIVGLIVFVLVLGPHCVDGDVRQRKGHIRYNASAPGRLLAGNKLLVLGKAPTDENRLVLGQAGGFLKRCLLILSILLRVGRRLALAAVGIIGQAETLQIVRRSVPVGIQGIDQRDLNGCTGSLILRSNARQRFATERTIQHVCLVIHYDVLKRGDGCTGRWRHAPAIGVANVFAGR